MRRVGLVAAALALIALGAGGGMALNTHLHGRARMADFAAAAVEQHQKLVRNVLPADIAGVTPKGAEAWFKQRLGFNMNLPDPHTDGLTFIGGRISHVRDIEAAALEYELEGKRVSLFIMPEEAYRRLNPADKPRFTVLSHRGYDVILWQSNGTGYTLVSEVGGRSCLVCHSPAEKVEEAITQRTRLAGAPLTPGPPGPGRQALPNHRTPATARIRRVCPCKGLLCPRACWWPPRGCWDRR